MAKRYNNRKKAKRKLSFSQKAFLVMSILIVISMVVAVFASYGGGGHSAF